MKKTKIGGTPSRVNPPAKAEGVALVLGQLGTGVPSVLTVFWETANGVSYDEVFLYGTDDIVERNHTYEVAEYDSSRILIGDDGSGNGFFVARNNELAPVYKIDLEAIGSSEGIEVAASFEQWANNNFSLSASNSLPANTTASIFLLKEPRQGLK